MVKIATKIIAGKSLKDQGLKSGLAKVPKYSTVKAPVFSFDKLKLVETSLGPEMKSTGEVLGLGMTKQDALYKAMVGSGLQVPKKGNVLLSIAKRDKKEALDIATRLTKLGFVLFGTKESYHFFKDNNIKIDYAPAPGEGATDVLEMMKENKIDLVFNTPTKGKSPDKLGFKVRRAAVEFKIPCITSIDTALSAISVLEEEKMGKDIEVLPLNDYIKMLENDSTA